jgi:hypothetical protein
VRTADIGKTLTDRKPLYAVAGAGEFAVEKLREVPARLATRRGAARRAEGQPQAVRGRISQRIGHLPGQVRALPGKAQEFAAPDWGRPARPTTTSPTVAKTMVGRVRRQRSRKEFVEQTGWALRGGRGAHDRGREGPGHGAKKTAEASAEKICD